MHVAAQLEFFTGATKAEKSARQKAMEEISEFRRLVNEEHLVPPGLVCTILGVSKQRLHVLCEEGKLEHVWVRRERWVKFESAVEYAKTRKTGRPRTRDLVEASIEVGKTWGKKS